MFALLIDTSSHARCMGHYLHLYIRSHRNGRGMFFSGNCVCMCVRSSESKWPLILLITGKGTLADTGCTNSRTMDPFAFGLPVQIQSRFVVNKSPYTPRAIQWPVWNEGLNESVMNVCPNPKAVILIGTLVYSGQGLNRIQTEFTFIALSWVKDQ